MNTKTEYNKITLSAERATTHELPHATATEHIGDLAVKMTKGDIPGFTIDPQVFPEPSLFSDLDVAENFSLVADHFPDHQLHDGVMHIGTVSGPTEIPHTDREDTFPSGTRDSFRIHRIESTSDAGAHVTLGKVEGHDDIPAATVFEVSSDDPDAHAVEYYKAHATPGTVTVFDATKFHQWVNDKDNTNRGNHISDLVRNRPQ